MSLTRPTASQINTSDIDTTEFASTFQTNEVQSNLDSFASYSNSSFSTGGGGGSFSAGVLLTPDIINPVNNTATLPATIAFSNNLLVYLDGLLQHPDTYIVDGSVIRFYSANNLPNVSVGVRYLASPSVLVSNTTLASNFSGSNGQILWDYERKRLFVYDGITVGGFYANATTTITLRGFQGNVSGYSSGGFTPPLLVYNTIDKFPFAADSNATDVGDLTESRYTTAGLSSDASGYISGGITYAPPPVGFTTRNTIDKFPFAADGNATDVGDLSQIRASGAGQSSTTHGYISGGALIGPTGILTDSYNTIDRIPFAADGNALDVGDLTQSRSLAAGQSSTTHGYTSGGSLGPVNTNVIDKFPFASNANASDMGDLTQAKAATAGQNSYEYGYSSGNFAVEKFYFAFDGNSFGVGNLSARRTAGLAGQSSTISGYTSGGTQTPTIINTVDKFPFASDGDATDVGDLTQGRGNAAGQQI